jgi:pimeloyl-ACP methyl ester carboxylesterase
MTVTAVTIAAGGSSPARCRLLMINRYHGRMAGPPYVRQRVPVAGGDLTVGVWGTEGPLVVAAHGVTATHQSWARVGPLLGPDHRFVAADLRGRGGSRDLPPPYGMAAHAVDLAAVIGAYGPPAILVGHSMGGFAVVRAVRDFPGLVSGAVLVDGGAPLPVPDGFRGGADELEEALAAVVGPAFARLSMTFASRRDYRDFWRAHPSFHPWHPAMDSYADYDLVGEPPALRPSGRLEAALRDSRDLYARPDSVAAPLGVAGVFLRAERGVMDEPDRPFYRPGWPTRWLPDVVESTVAGVNHYTITLGEAGAAAVAVAVRGGTLASEGE